MKRLLLLLAVVTAMINCSYAANGFLKYMKRLMGLPLLFCFLSFLC